MEKGKYLIHYEAVHCACMGLIINEYSVAANAVAEKIDSMEAEK